MIQNRRILFMESGDRPPPPAIDYRLTATKMLQMVESLWFLLSALVMGTHLLCVNVASVGPLFCIAFEMRAGRSPQSGADIVGKWLAYLCCKLLIIGILLGMLLVGIKWLRGGAAFFLALERVPSSRLWWGAAELVFYLACVLTYAAFWQLLCVGRRRWLHRVLALAAATNLMYHFPPLFAVIRRLAAGDGKTVAIDEAAIDKAEFLRLTMQPEIVAVVVHHLIAGFAITGMFIMLRSRLLLDELGGGMEDRQVELTGCIRRAARTALVASLLQIPVGVWVLFAIPPQARQQVLGGSDLYATALFVFAMLAAMAALYALALVALGESDRKTVRASAIRLMFVVFAMTALAQKIL